MKKILLFVLLLGAFLVSGQVLAQDNSVLIAQLQAQIAALQEQVRALQNQQRGGFCYDFTEDFGSGYLENSQLSSFNLNSLYRVMKLEGFDVSGIRNDSVIIEDVGVAIYGPNYIALVKKFQTKYGIPATGFVGPLTRAKLNSLYGCRDNPAQTVKVLSPNGGETWASGFIQDIRWQTVAGAVAKVDLYLVHKWPCEIDSPGNCAVPAIYVADWQAPILLDRNIDVNTAYHWIVATDINDKTISSGTYVVKICAAGSQTNCDSSDHVFTIVLPSLPSSGLSATHN